MSVQCSNTTQMCCSMSRPLGNLSKHHHAVLNSYAILAYHHTALNMWVIFAHYSKALNS